MGGVTYGPVVCQRLKPIPRPWPRPIPAPAALLTPLGVVGAVVVSRSCPLLNASTASLTVPETPVMISIPAAARTCCALGPTRPVMTSYTPRFTMVWAAWTPAPLAADWLVLGMTSIPMVAESTITKHRHLPNRGSI